MSCPIFNPWNASERRNRRINTQAFKHSTVPYETKSGQFMISRRMPGASHIYCHPKPTTGVPTDPGAGAMVVEGMSAEDRARIDSRIERCKELDLKNLLGTNLSRDERAELERQRIVTILAFGNLPQPAVS
jgi:hypothetical protein